MAKGDNKRQITFRLDPILWKEFSMKCLEKDKSKTKVLIEMIEKFLKK